MNRSPKCTNAEPGTFNHECGNIATVRVRYLVTEADVPPYSCAPAGEYETHFCARCWRYGTEARRAHRLAVSIEEVNA